MSIFTKRVAFKPFEYPEVVKFKEAIQHSYWLVSEFSFISDVQDFHTKLSDPEKIAVKRAMLAISQIEVAVKKFWTKIGDRFPKAEFDQVGIVFGESEVRHSDAYSHLLQVLGLNAEFDNVLNHPVIQGRVEYLTKYLSNSNSINNELYSITLTLFSLFVENVSLFSQFLVMKSFNKHRNWLKDIDNVIQSTLQEENLHAQFGAYLVNEIKKENPDWFGEEFYNRLENACRKAYEAESKIIDWIFESGDLPFLTKNHVDAFIQKRFNDSLAMVGGKPIFNPDQNLLKDLQWFDEEIYAQLNTDFFSKKPNTYSKNMQSCTAEDLF